MIARRVSVALVLAALAAGCGGDSQCGGGAHSSLSVWSEKGGKVGVTFSLSGARPREAWRLVFVHEGHVRWRGRVAADADGRLKLHQRVGDYRGVDHVSVRAYGPGGATCSASASLSDVRSPKT
jgi:hypothetical protein